MGLEIWNSEWKEKLVRLLSYTDLDTPKRRKYQDLRALNMKTLFSFTTNVNIF